MIRTKLGTKPFGAADKDRPKRPVLHSFQEAVRLLRPVVLPVYAANGLAVRRQGDLLPVRFPVLHLAAECRESVRILRRPGVCQSRPELAAPWITKTPEH